MQVIFLGGAAACACEHMFDYTNNPENILTLILHSFIRSHFLSDQMHIFHSTFVKLQSSLTVHNILLIQPSTFYFTLH